MTDTGEHTSPDRHLSGAMCRHVQITLDSVKNFQLRKLAAIALSELRKIRGLLLQRRPSRPIPFSFRAVTRGTVSLKHLLAGCRGGRRDWNPLDNRLCARCQAGKRYE